MTRRPLLSMLVIALAAATPGGARAADPAVSTGACQVSHTDRRGDTGPIVAGVVVPYADTDADILRVDWTGSPSHLVVTFSLAAMRPSPTYEGRGVTAGFRLHDKDVRFGYVQSFRRGDASFVEVNGRRSAAAVSAAYDVPRNTVVMTVPRSEIERFVGGPVSGNRAKSLAASTFWVVEAGLQVDVDEASPGSTVSLDIAGCDARPGTLAYSGRTSFYYGDPLRFGARLFDADRRPVPNARLTFSFQGRSVTVTTSGDGGAYTSFPPVESAGVYSLEIAFAGTPTVRGVTIRVPVTVLPERTALSASVSKRKNTRSVTATLTTGDKTPLAGMPLRFSVAGTTVATGTTNSRGQVTWSDAKPGQVVHVEFPGVDGRYAPSSTSKKT